MHDLTAQLVPVDKQDRLGPCTKITAQSTVLFTVLLEWDNIISTRKAAFLHTQITPKITAFSFDKIHIYWVYTKFINLMQEAKILPQFCRAMG